MKATDVIGICYVLGAIGCIAMFMLFSFSGGAI